MISVIILTWNPEKYIENRLAMGRPVAATSIGCEGIAVTPGEHVIVADTAEEFAQAVVDLLGDAGRRQALGAAGRALVEREYSWNAIAERLETEYVRILKEGGHG